MAIRGEAFDDILWVVLGWLETIQSVDAYAKGYDPAGGAPNGWDKRVSDILLNQTWYGTQWVPAFAHRARIFWDLGDTGWDSKLCGGGMNWNPRFEPYKNAVTIRALHRRLGLHVSLLSRGC